jgi:ABC-type Mn2+/Zn2+ transport system permease subunit
MIEEVTMSGRRRLTAVALITVMALLTVGVLVLFEIWMTPPIEGAAEEKARVQLIVVAVWAGAMVLGGALLAALWRSRSPRS